MLAAGTTAPDFSAKLDDGSTFTLSEWRGQKHIVLYFYPKDDTRGCTREACAFRDNFDDISSFDALIIGVSADSEASHTSFREKHGLPFPLIADTDKRVSKLYEARGLFGMMTSRITYIIDKNGVIRDATNHMMRVGEHLNTVLAALQAMPATEPASG